MKIYAPLYTYPLIIIIYCITAYNENATYDKIKYKKKFISPPEWEMNPMFCNSNISFNYVIPSNTVECYHKKLIMCV